ncbi:uncharacterized protein LOC126744367 [Anthonomus grandis grandis]|uniref:uncharacterized protein LOC126744367 n=1 Tax=Anthonomus grandis grandis TaxID=2921223 RepID=UPI002165C747|nr:uncharacterized protein LOC126744367 [Anthonomus grandis grandis]
MPILDKKLERGECERRSSENMLVVKWNDWRDVTMLTTLHENKMVSLPKKDRVTNENLQKPLCVLEYNNQMGAVDRSDMMISSTDSRRKSIKWYKKLFFHTIDISLLNAHAMYLTQSSAKVPLATFQLAVIRQLLERLQKRASRSVHLDLRNKRLTQRYFPDLVTVREGSKSAYRRGYVDDTTDITQCSQCSIIIWLVNLEGLLVERFLGFNDVSSDRIAENLFSVLDNIFDKFDYTNKLVGQCYDGASVMAGHLNGLQHKVKEKAPKAIFVHCLAHRLNLVLQQSFKKICARFLPRETGFLIGTIVRYASKRRIACVLRKLAGQPSNLQFYSIPIHRVSVTIMSTNQPVAAKLIKKRQSYIKRLEAIYNLAIECQNHPSKLNLLRARAEDFPSICSSFETLHLDILACSDDDKQDEQHSLGNTFDEMKYVVHSLLRELLPPVDVVPKSGCKSNNHSFSELPSDDHDHDLDLPRIKVPVFSGNRRDWPAFYDLFRTLVHEKRSLSDIQRFQHLQMAVQGEAAELIRNIALTEANYPVAFNALIKRFENKRALATDYWQAIYNAPPAKTHSAGDLRRLITTFSQNMEALNSLQGIDLWDFTKLNLLLQKIDPSLKTRFEIECSDKPIPRYGDLTRFLNKTCKALENSVLLNEPKVVSQSNSKQKESYDPNRSKRVVPTKAYMTNTEQKCLFCNLSSHPLVKCTKFIEAEVSARYSFIKQQHMCFNCFSRTHSVPRCLGTKVCKICSKKHHTLLHFQPINDVPNVSEVKEPPTVNATSVVPCLTSVLSHEEPTLFATAEISVYNISQDLFPCRAMLDCASVANFVTLSCVQQLALPITPSQIPIQGINNMSTASSLGTVKLKVLSTTGPCLEFEAIVVHSICENTPTFPINPSKWKHLRGLELADKNFAVPHGIDLLLGVPLFSEIILPGFRKSINGSPCAIKTIFGWILIGGNNTPTNEFVSLCTYVPSTIPVESPLDINLHKFWELEDVPDKVLLSPEEQRCEDFFVSTCSQKPDGRYVVRLPFKQPDIDLGDTRHQALRRFNLLENRLIRNPSLRSLYNDFMQDYLDQNHMIPCTSADNLSYYFPHHCVVKDDSGTTKIRVVFDGSSKGSNNLSLNDVLLPGPKLQNDIVTILLTFRFFPIVFSTDIRQMYRMIGIHEQDLKYQKILWRFDPSNPIQEYTLCTVTYGLNCSPYLAIRTLHQLAKDYGKEFPLARDILLKSTYVDDIIGLGHSVKGILELQKQLTDLLFCGGFELRKWTSNCKELLSLVPESHQHNISFNDNANCTLKILGLQWNPVLDVFSYSVKPIARECTKRVILSEIAKIYDPLGFVAPVVLVAKCLIQRLWIQGVGWDEVPTSDVVSQWQVYVSQLPLLSSFAIPRHVTISDAVCTELHGYCDASLLAYGGVLYMRQIDSEGNVHVNLLCAKSKVCPLKVLSVPRLETCAALLLSNLMHFVITNSPIKFDRIYAWSDSSVALYWIKSHPSRLKTFVANRVQQIQDRIPPNRWFHISGVGNPADCLSRSLLPKQLLDHPLWFNGPPWLKLSHELWPTPLEFDPKDNPIAL